VKNLQDQIKELRNSFPSVSSISSDSVRVFFDKYGTDKSGGKLKFDGVFVPGLIYSADYFTKSKPSKSQPYINRKPLFLFLKSDKYLGGEILVSLDLNIIPPDSRGEIILKIWNQFFAIINENEKNKSIQSIPNIYNSLKTILNGTGWQNSLTGFKKEYIRNVKVVDYEDWVRIPYLDDFQIEGQSISSIYNDYRSKLNP
jgi:hypothetical protein